MACEMTVTPFPVAGKDCELSHTQAGLQGEEDTQLLTRQKLQEWPCSRARIASPGCLFQPWHNPIGSARVKCAKGGTGKCVQLWCAKGWGRQAWLGRCRRVLLGHASNTCEKAELAGRGLR